MKHARQPFGWRRAAAVYTIAVVVNYPWEMTQSVLFAPMGTLLQGTWRCFVASLGDGLLVLGIFAVGWIAYRRADWIESPGLAGYSVMLATGFLIAVTVEWLALKRGRWTYRSEMPLIPGLDVGVVPVLQMLALPPLIFRLSARWLHGQARGKGAR